jgi:predicted protein tyrosine phosphatase
MTFSGWTADCWSVRRLLANIIVHSNITRMKQRQEPAILISPYQQLPKVLEENDISHVVSILGRSDKLEWPSVGTRRVLRLEFDDIIYSSGSFIAPNREQIAELIEFAGSWNASGTLLLHCRAASSRSPAAGMIAAAALGRPDTASLVLRIRTAKAYHRPNESMLKLADDLLGNGSTLVNLARSVPMPTRTDEWEPVTIPLPPFRTA